MLKTKELYCLTAPSYNSEVKLLAGQQSLNHHHRSLWGQILPCLFRLLVAQMLLGLWLHNNLSPVSHGCLCPVSKFPSSYRDTSDIRLKVHPKKLI